MKIILNFATVNFCSNDFLYLSLKISHFYDTVNERKHDPSDEFKL